MFNVSTVRSLTYRWRFQNLVQHLSAILHEAGILLIYVELYTELHANLFGYYGALKKLSIRALNDLTYETLV